MSRVSRNYRGSIACSRTVSLRYPTRPCSCPNWNHEVRHPHRHQDQWWGTAVRTKPATYCLCWSFSKNDGASHSPWSLQSVDVMVYVLEHRWHSVYVVHLKAFSIKSECSLSINQISLIGLDWRYFQTSTGEWCLSCEEQFERAPYRRWSGSIDGWDFENVVGPVA